MDVLVEHECAQCGATIERCDELIREQGRGCCPNCLQADTHGLLRSLDATSKALGARIAEVDGQTVGHTELLAQMVIFRTEAASAMRQLLASEQRHEEEIALLRGRVEALERLARQHLDATTQIIEQFEDRLRHFDQDQAVMDYTALGDRLHIVELCIEGIEKKLNLKRRATPREEPAAEPAAEPEVATVAVVGDEAEAHRKRWRRKGERGADDANAAEQAPEPAPSAVLDEETEPRRKRRRRKQERDDDYFLEPAEGWD